jgi:hypothetical protein
MVAPETVAETKATKVLCMLWIISGESKSERNLKISNPKGSERSTPT